MSLNPNSLGLAYPINSRFRVIRTINGRTCPHSGIDIATNGVSVAFLAGLFGRVIGLGVDTNSVAVEPFGRPGFTVRYLHCASRAVSEGDLVYPWSQLGTTGDVGGGSTGIHLHVDVVRNGVPSSEPSCWSREYVDPETFETPDTMSGSWYFDEGSRGATTFWQTLTLSSSQVGGRVRLSLHAFWISGHCYVNKESIYNGTVTARNGNGLSVAFGPGSCQLSVEGNCRPQCRPLGAWNTSLSLRGPMTLSMGRNKFVKRGPQAFDFFGSSSAGTEDCFALSTFSEALAGENEELSLSQDITASDTFDYSSLMTPSNEDT